MADGRIVNPEGLEVKLLSGVAGKRLSVVWAWWLATDLRGGRLYHCGYCALEDAYRAEVGRASHRAFWGHQPSLVAVAGALLRRGGASAGSFALASDDARGRAWPRQYAAPALDLALNTGRQGVA